MPPSIKNEFTRNPVATIAAVLASILALASLLVMLWVVPRWTAEIEQRLAYNERMDEKHHDDSEVHMPFKEKVVQFVTRPEWVTRGANNDRQFDEIRSSQVRQETKIDKIYEIISERRQ